MIVASSRTRTDGPAPTRFVVALAALLLALSLLALSAARAAAGERDTGRSARGDQMTQDGGPTATDDAPVLQFAAEPTSTPETPSALAAPGLAEEPGDPGIPDAAAPLVAETPAPELGGGGAEMAAELADVVVRRHVCFSAVDAIADDVDALAEACPDPLTGGLLHPGTQYVLLLNKDGVTTPAVADANAVSEWPHVQLGTYRLGTNLSPGFGEPIIHCRTDVGNSPWQRHPVDHSGTSIELTVANAAFLCDWYDTPGPVPVTVHAWYCPPAVDTSGLDLADLLAACTPSQHGTPFTLLTNGFADEQATVDGVVTLTGLAFLLASVQSAPPNGYADPTVYCGLDDGAGAFSGPIPAPGGAIALDLASAPGSPILCHWFTPVDPGIIAVTKWLCPPGYDLAAPGADPAADCATPYDGVQFAFGPGLGPPAAAVTGEDGPGHFFFGGLEPGSYAVAEDVPPGIADHYVYCLRSVPSENPMLGPALGVVEPAVIDGAIALDLAENETITCDWYNVPAEEDDDQDNDGDGGDDDGGNSEGEDDGAGDDGADDDGGAGEETDDDQSGDDQDGSNGSVIVVMLPDTGAGPPAPDRDNVTDRWVAPALFFALWAIGHLLVRRQDRPTALAERPATVTPLVRTYRRR